MSLYVTVLTDLAVASQAESAARRQADKSARRHMEPLELRLRGLLKTIPTEQQAQGLALASITNGLRGKWRGNASPGEVGAAMRRLGWRRIRRWHGDADGFRALWFPPVAH